MIPPNSLALTATTLLAPVAVAAVAPAQAATPQKPNIILFLADDLGYHETGAYGQTKIKTPNIDQLARDGVKFTNFYAGQSVCAPSRASLLTGLHSGHSTVRDNAESNAPEIKEADGYPTQMPLRADDVTFAKVLQNQGYTTACIGKWGLGHPTDSGDPMKHGFDLFYGQYSQYQGHFYYPTYLWRNHTKEPIAGNGTTGEEATGKVYAPDLMENEALKFINDSKGRPFMLYFATPVPHVSLQIPDDEPSLAGYRKAFPDDPPSAGGHYTASPHPRATYAAMVTRMDRTLGKMRAALKASGQEKNTIIVFSSDNGASMTTAGYNHAFFETQKPKLRGTKAQLWEGGIRVPTIAAWPGQIAPGQTSDFVGASWDFFPTFATLSGAATPEGLDGVSLLPTLLGQPQWQQQHQYLYWEMSSGGQQAMRMNRWKGVRMGVKGDPAAPLQLFDLDKDMGETRDVAAQNPAIVEQLKTLMRRARTVNPNFGMGPLDKEQ